MNKTWRTLLLLGGVILLAVGFWVGRRVAANSISPQEISGQGFQGKFFAKSGVEQQLAVIVIGGGQEGDYWGREFALAGLVGLSLPYTGQEGLPPRPEEIPLEYFAKAISWLKQQPEVEPDKIIVMGASRNAELALVLASTLSESVSGVIAFAPSSISWSNTVLPYNSDQIKASWTYQGEAIPYLPMAKIKGTNASKIETIPYWQAGIAKVDQYETAFIPVENINGPILLLSGKDDQIWPATMMSDMIANRLKANAFPHPFENIQYEDAGHLISRNLATVASGREGQLTIDGKQYKIDFGGSIEGDTKAIQDARERIFSYVFDFQK